jgi:hypothetical protein
MKFTMSAIAPDNGYAFEESDQAIAQTNAMLIIIQLQDIAFIFVSTLLGTRLQALHEA